MELADSTELSALRMFLKHSDGKYMPKGEGFRVREELTLTEINDWLASRAIKVDPIKLSNVNERIAAAYKELEGKVGGTDFNKAKVSTLLIKYGFRPEEIGSITKKNIKYSEEQKTWKPVLFLLVKVLQIY